MPFRPVFLLALMLCLLLGSGCSMVRVGYGHFDSVAEWTAHDYFDLNSEQRSQFSQRFDRLHDWHRQTQLPEYAKFLADFQSRSQRGLREADMLWLVDGFKQRYARIAAHAAADAADLLATLTPEQIEVFRQQMDKANRKFLSENRSNESAENRRQAQNRRTLSQLSDWVGPLSDAQQQRIRELLREVPLTDRLRHEDRLRRQREFLALLETRGAERKVFAARLRDWLVNWEQSRPPALARAFEDSWHKRAAFYATVDGMLTPAQRSHLLRRLQNYSEDFIVLAGESPAATTADCARISAC